MKKNYIIYLILLVLIIVGGILVYYINKKNELTNNINKANYETKKSKVEIDSASKKQIQDQTQNQTNAQSETTSKQVPVETEIGIFTTQIYNKDPERQNNIKITCETLNNKEVKNGETFSFTTTIGKATTSKGYQKADIIVNGKKEQGLGGGNCQVSSTLYNAVLTVPGLEVTERHEHSGHVPYVEDGKDAAVAYGTHDFKFINNTGNAIKIVSESNENEVIIKINKIS